MEQPFDTDQAYSPLLSCLFIHKAFRNFRQCHIGFLFLSKNFFENVDCLVVAKRLGYLNQPAVRSNFIVLNFCAAIIIPTSRV